VLLLRGLGSRILRSAGTRVKPPGVRDCAPGRT